MVASMRSTWWSITVFDVQEIEMCQKSQMFPLWCRSVHGGVEKCPDTGRLHFQGAIQAHRQVRFTQVKQWLPTAHIEAARDIAALKKYVMKSETAVGEKTVRTNFNTLSNMCSNIARVTMGYFYERLHLCTVVTLRTGEDIHVRQWVVDSVQFRSTAGDWYTFNLDDFEVPIGMRYGAIEEMAVTWYWSGVNCLIRQDPESASSFANPALPKFYARTALCWYLPIEQTDRQTDTPPANEIVLDGGSGAPEGL